MIPVIYNLRSLKVRKASTIASAFGIALVVFVLASSMMLTNGVKKTLGRAGSSDQAIVLRRGSDAELSSSMDDPAHTGIVLSAPGVKKGADGQPMGVRETVVVIAADKVGAQGFSNVTVRGVSDGVYAMRDGVKLIEGRRFQPGSNEVILGKKLVGRFKGLALGQTFELKRNRPATVVGIFDDGGSSFESEVWGDLDSVRAAFNRQGVVSSVRVKLEDASRYDAFEQAIEQDKQLGLEVTREPEFYEKQSEGLALFINTMGTVIAVLFALGAMIGATITMHASVAHRYREVGTLRALGFSKGAILTSFLLESVILAAVGGVIGLAFAQLMGMVDFAMINMVTWSELVFTFEPTPQILANSFKWGAIMGLVGGFFPAFRASRISPIEAMRS